MSIITWGYTTKHLFVFGQKQTLVPRKWHLEGVQYAENKDIHPNFHHELSLQRYTFFANWRLFNLPKRCCGLSFGDIDNW